MIVVSRHPMSKYADRYCGGVIRNIVTKGQVDEQRSTDHHLVIVSDTGFIATIDKHRIISIDDVEVNFPKPPQNLAIKVKGSKGDIYDVRRYNGIETCSCKAYQFRRSCKHLLQLAA
jgi:hypothetical protein